MTLGLGLVERITWGTIVAVAVMAGCADSSAFEADTEDLIDMPTPPGNCSAGTGAEPCPNADDTGTPGNPVGGSCLEPDDCMAGLGCVAPYEDGEIGEFRCTDQCIPLADEGAWCLDAAACCDAGTLCQRGLCVLDESAGSGTDAGSGSTGDGGSSSGDAGTAGSSGGESSGSSTAGMQ